MKQKRKDKNQLQKESQDQLKEIKNMTAEGKNLLDKAIIPPEFQLALDIFNRVISRATMNSQVQQINQLYHMRGMCHFKLNHFELAQKDFQEAILMSEDKNKGPFYHSLGKCKMQLAKKDPAMYEQATKCFQKVLQYNKNDGDANLNLGLVCRKLKNSPTIKAIRHFTQALKVLKYNDQFQAYIERGICYREVQELQNSIEDFLRACQIKKEDPYPHFNLGINYLLCNEHEQSLERLTTAIELKKNDPQFHNYKALALFMTGQYDQSLYIFEDALKLYEAKGSRQPEVGECWYNLGNAFLNLNRCQQALDSFKKAREFDLDDKLQIKVFYAEGRTFEHQKNIRAIQKFKECILLIEGNKTNPLFLSSLYHLAENQQMHKLYSEAIVSLTSILESDCQEKCVYEERGKAYLLNQNYSEALRDFQMVESFVQNYPDVFYFKGKAKTQLGQIQSAIKDFFRAIELGSRNISIFNGISEAYLRGGKFQKALIYSNISLEKESKNQEFLIQRSRIYLELNQYRKGITDLSNALDVNSKNPIVYYRRGLAFYKNKDYVASIKDLQQSLQYEPNRKIQSDIYYHIGIAYSNLEKFDEAIQPLSKAIQLEPISKYYHQRAKCQILLDKNLNALNDLNQVIKDQPQNAFAFFRRGFAHKALKKYDQAAEDFMKARELSPSDPRLIINKKQIYQTKYRKLCEAGEEE